MKLTFDREGWAEYLEWQREDPKIVARINTLIAECLRHPSTGTGKPELLKRDLSGWCSRRITGGHRLVYRVSGSGEAQVLEVLSCCYYY